MKLNNLVKSLLIIITGALVFASCAQEKEQPQPGEKTKAIDIANMDTTIRPGDDFYIYANGVWMDENPIPAEEVRFGSFTELQNQNLEHLRKMFETAEDNVDVTKNEAIKKIGTFYLSGMDTTTIETLNLQPIESKIENIENIENTTGIMENVAEIQTYGIDPVFHFYVGQDEKNSEMMIANFYQGGLGLPDREYYLSDDEKYKEIRIKYVGHIQKMFELTGVSEEEAVKAANNVMEIETKLAELSRTRVELRDPQKNYNKMTVTDLQKEVPQADWTAYFKAMGLTDPGDINVSQTDFIKGAGELLEKASVEEWKDYLQWNLIHAAAPYMSGKFVKENFAFYGKVLSGQEEMKPRWKRVVQSTSSSLGELVGKEYVERHFPPEAKERMLELVKNLRAAFHEHIDSLDWMTEETKEKAHEKLAKMNVKIGYPDKWKDYSGLEIDRDSYLENVFAARELEFRRDLAKIGRPVDEDEWHMTPQTVNAYYNPTMNEIVFPAAILQPPFFWLEADDAVNYGAIGAVIGHEMTHGFDDQGRQYDVEGNLKDWWTPEDASQFNELADLVVGQYDKIIMIDSMAINGKMTLGENIADFGGVSISGTAFRKTKQGQTPDSLIDGFTPMQRFYLSYAQVWRMNIRDQELRRRLKVDVHSPAKARVNAVVANIPEFYETFNVDVSEEMYIPEEERVKIW